MPSSTAAFSSPERYSQLFLLLVAACLPLSADAQEAVEDCSHPRYVVVEAVPAFDATLAIEVRKDLSAELTPRGIGVCSARGSEGEVAADIELRQSEASQISIHVDDYTTGKRVARDVPLARIPVGGRALAIAIAIDELLRASWAELTLRRDESDSYQPVESSGESEPQRFTRKRTLSSVSRAPYKPSPHALNMGVLAGFTHTSQDFDAFSLTLRGQARPFGWGWFALGLSGVMALPVDAPSGVAKANGWAAGLTLGGCTAAGTRLIACGGARATAQWTQFRGSEARAGQALRNYATALVTSLAVQLDLSLSERLSLLADVAVGGAPVAARATDGARTVMAVDGLVMSLGLGLGVAL